MQHRKVYHVTKSGAGWKGRLENTSHEPVTGHDKEEVISRTIAMAKCNTMSCVVIHKADGSIQEERTYPLNQSVTHH